MEVRDWNTTSIYSVVALQKTGKHTLVLTNQQAFVAISGIRGHTKHLHTLYPKAVLSLPGTSRETLWPTHPGRNGIAANKGIYLTWG